MVKRTTSERLQKSLNSFQKFLNGRTRVLSCKTYYFCPFQKSEIWRFKIIKDEDSRRKAVLAAHPCRPRRGTRILVRPLLRSLALRQRLLRPSATFSCFWSINPFEIKTTTRKTTILLDRGMVLCQNWFTPHPTHLTNNL